MAKEMAKELTKELELYCGQIPKLYKAKYKKAMQGRSLRAAVDAKCQDCTCWQRLEIADCQAVTCPLYLYRPYQVKLVSQSDVESDAPACPSGGTLGTKVGYKGKRVDSDRTAHKMPIKATHSRASTRTPIIGTIPNKAKARA